MREVRCGCCGETFPVFRPAVMEQYLLDREWRLTEVDSTWRTYMKLFPAGVAQLEVGQLVDAGDYNRCHMMVLQNLMKIEERSISEIVKDIQLVEDHLGTL